MKNDDLPVDDEPTGGVSGETPGGWAPGAGLADLTGKQIGRYLLGQRLGSGGVATVYRAYDQVVGQTVALKLLLPSADEKAYSRFRREATTASALRHPNIVRILQIGVAPMGQVAYIAMELVEGQSLADLLNERGRLRPAESANLLEPIARALSYAHGQGVVHRDVKPGNILLRPAQPGAANSVQLESLDFPVVPLLSDFGIARAVDAPELTSAGRTVGTPAYMAPEQCAGSREVDGRADIYALGAVLYRTISGRLPFVGSTTQILHAHVYEPLTIDDVVLRQLPPVLVEVLQRSMAKQPGDRYATAGAMADALALAAGRLPPRPGLSAQESTATLTLSALPAVALPPEAPATTVLVPGAGGGAAGAPASPGAAPGRPPTNPLLRPTTPAEVVPVAPPPMYTVLDEAEGVGGGRLERLNWAGIALGSVAALLVIGLFVAVGIQGPGLLQRVVGPPERPTPGTVAEAVTPALPGGGLPPITATVAASATVEVVPTWTPDLQATAMVAATATLAPAMTSPPATATPEPPTATPEPPTATPEPPTATPTGTPTGTETPTPTVSPTATPTPTVPATVPATAPVTVTPGPSAELAGCLDQIDESLRTYIVNQFGTAEQELLGCPTGPAQRTPAYALPFERGFIFAFDDAPEVYVLYTESQQWERQFVPDTGQGEPEVEPPSTENLYVPQGQFGEAWAQGERRNELGYALEPEAVSFDAAVQLFPGAVLISNLNSGDVVILPTGRQR